MSFVVPSEFLSPEQGRGGTEGLPRLPRREHPSQRSAKRREQQNPPAPSREWHRSLSPRVERWRFRLGSVLILMLSLSACGNHERSGDLWSAESPVETPVPTPAPNSATSPKQYRLEFRQEVAFSNCCDGSGAVLLDDPLMAVANDEDNVLRIYNRHRGGNPLQSIQLSSWLDLKPDDEADLEAMARWKDRILVIGSHASSKDGDRKPHRRRLLEMHYSIQVDGRVQFAPAGPVYTRLVEDLARAPSLQTLNLGLAATRESNEIDGLNIEGLAQDGAGTLWLGFRGPVVNGRAILVPILNPGELSQARPARFGPPVMVDLEGMGIRGLDTGKAGIWALGEAEHEGKQRALFLVEPKSGDVLRRIPLPATSFNPEALMTLGEQRDQFFLLSDDGDLESDGIKCKDREDLGRRNFRGRLAELIPLSAQSL